MSGILHAARFVQFLILCARAYIGSGKSESMFYGTLSLYGVPVVALVVAREREAWRVSNFYADATAKHICREN